MSDPRTIRVNCTPSYTVTVGCGLQQECGERLRETIGLCNVAVISDSYVAPLYLEGLLASLQKAGFSTYSYVFQAGEASKNLQTLSEILEFLAESHLTRTDCVIALGGGVCGDITGFAAGCYLRGIRCVQLPTTLLAAVDSSVGGKTAVDLRAGKNLAGVFLQPSAVLCDILTLKTLTPAYWADGMAEVIKTGVLSGEELFNLCSSPEIAAAGSVGSTLADVIARCVAYKASVVEQDPFEAGMRKLLNLGHTVGHAIEKCSNYTISHGHAVAAGMAIIARASYAKGWCSAECCRRIQETLLLHQLPISTTYSAEELAEVALIDKKRSGNTITVIIPEAIGHCTLKSIPVSELTELFRLGLETEVL